MKKRQLLRSFLQEICSEKNLLMTAQYKNNATQKVYIANIKTC